MIGQPSFAKIKFENAKKRMSGFVPTGFRDKGSLAGARVNLVTLEARSELAAAWLPASK